MTDKKSAKKPGWLYRLFHRSSLARDLSKIEKLTDKQLRKKKLKEKLFLEHHQIKKKKKRRVVFSVADVLRKAAIDILPIEFKKRIFFASVAISLVLTIAVLISGVIGRKGALNLLIFLSGFWTVGFLMVLVIVSLAAAVFLDIRIYNRRKEVERVLPDFLQLTAANIGAGMTIDRALWMAVRPQFGILAKEIETVAKHVITGEDLDDALRGFAKQYDSPLLYRSINLLLEGVSAGGRIADLLHKIAIDIEEQRILQKEMSANVTTYVIFISFATVAAAPFLFGLATELLIVIKAIAAGIGEESMGGGFSVTPDVISLSDFRIFSVSILTISGVFSAMIISVIRNGNVMESLRYIPFFIIISVTLYFLSIAFFGSIFTGIV